MNVDTLIQNGRVIDGTGAPERRGDVAIRDGRIVAIDARGHEQVEAVIVIDASGKVVAPGFVDIHSHGDLVLAWPSDDRLPLIEGRIAQGITTEVIGNCGLGASPLFGHGGELLPQINGWMTPASFDWSWRDVAGYFDHLEELGLPLNVGTLVPHGALRLGAAHLAPGDTDETARRQMYVELDRALEQGAFGLSAGLIYPPGMYTSTDELITLARRLVAHDAVFTSHVRGSSETLLDSVDELIHIGREANVHVHHSHAEAVGRAHWSKLDRFLDMEHQAQSDGVHLSADMFPYPVAATMMLAIYPPWSLEGGLSRLIERLQDEDTRARIRRDIGAVCPQWPPWEEGGWPHNLVMAVGWERIRVSSVGSDANKAAEGLSLAELGEQRRSSPFDAISDLMVEEDGNVGQFVLDITGEDGLRELVRRPDIAFITDANDFGKGKPHPAAYGSFPRVLGRYVRDESLLSLPEAIRRMTSLPADMIGLEGRGRLEQGALADIVVFDPEAVRDEATLDEPRRNARGIDAVLVNGTLTYERGRLSGELAGSILRRGSP
ncbi:MAG: amidohydrolase family protein [Acidobacteriota bacterium]|nr:MAG: amidohydrolase family protein [Acidobacteriota bacterium]